jgi:glycosyltransferase involved in cell wall biosynthesis
MNEKISVVIPALNEEKNIAIVLGNMPSFVDEVVVVDGYSKDRTSQIALELGAKVIFDRIGKGSALRNGLEEARGDIIITMDADCSHGEEEMIRLVEAIRSGYDVCMASRFIEGGGTEDMTLVRKIGNRLFVTLVNLIWGTRYSDLCYGYRSFRKDCIGLLDLKCNDFGIETEISIKTAKKKLKVIEVPSFEKGRKEGEGKLKTFRDGFHILRRIVIEALSR